MVGMWKTLRTLSAVSFYVLGGSFFLATLFIRNDVGGSDAAIWLQVADLPLALSAFIFGGMSLYVSLRPDRPSRILAWGIGVPLSLLFLFLVFLNFYEVLETL